MYKTRIRKIIGDVWSRKGRTALVAIAIFIGVTGTIALFSFSDIIVTQLREDIQEDELPMLSVFLRPDVGASIPTQEENVPYLELLEDVPGVSELQASVAVSTQIKLAEDDESFQEASLNAFSLPFAEMLIGPMRLVAGAYPGAGEVAVEQRMADRLDLTPGDEIYFRVLSEDESGEIGTVESRTVSGVVFHPYAFTPLDETIYTSYEDATYIAGSTGYSLMQARFTDFPTAQDQQETFNTVIANQTPYGIAFVFAENPAQNGQIQGAQTLASTMGFLALVALLVSGFLVINVISSLVVEQKRQIGVMKSMGATRGDNFYIYAGIAFVYGLIGVIPGTILGIIGGNAISTALAPELGTIVEGFNTSPPAIILGVAVGLLVPVLASIIPVWNGTRVRILDAMTDLGISSDYGSGPIARFIKLLPLPATIRQGLSNVSTKKGRLAFTVVTLSIAAGAFMGIAAVFNSVISGLDIYVDNFNVEIGIAPSQPRLQDEIVTVLQDNLQTEGNNLLRSIEPGSQLQVEFEGYEPVIGGFAPPGIFAYGYDVVSDTPAFNVTVTEGDELNEDNRDNGVIFSSLLADNMGKSIGDTVVMKVPGNNVELEIVGISDFPLDQIWIDWRVLAESTGNVFTQDIQSPLELPEEAAAFIRYANTVQSGEIEVAALGLTAEATGFLAVQLVEGQVFTRGESEVIVSASLAETYGMGDSIDLTSPASDETRTFTVTGVLAPTVVLPGLPEAYVGLYWEDLAALDGVNLEGTPVPDAYFLLTTLDNPDARDLDPIIEEIDTTMLENGITIESNNFIAIIDQFTGAFSTFQVILQMVSLLIAVVGALGLLTTLSMSVFERQKEIGVMRSIGASSTTVATQFLTEGLVVGIISWALGLPIGILIMLGLLDITGLGDTFPASFPVDAVIIGLIGMVVITTVASLSPALSAARKTVSEVLRYQ